MISVNWGRCLSKDVSIPEFVVETKMIAMILVMRSESQGTSSCVLEFLKGPVRRNLNLDAQRCK